jgi:predicted deacetylase
MSTAYLASIHDVMPETLDRVDEIVADMDANGWAPAILLVVPGRGWASGGLERLRRLVERGHTLAGHGWTHQIHRVRNARHLAHSVFLSRRVAEHYTLDALGVDVLVRRCRRWFVHHGLPEPELYVPPAWGLGPVTASRLAARGGYRFVETLSGIFDAARDEMLNLPVIGFEADTRLRAAFLKASNARSIHRGRRIGTVRLAIHPDDYNLRLAEDLKAIIRGSPDTVDLQRLQARFAA